MSHKGRDLEVRGKRRRSGSGSAIERRGQGGEQVWSREMDGMLEVLLKEADFGVLSGAVERILQKQKTESEKAMFLEKSLSLALQLQDVSNKLARQHAAQHNSVAWPLTQDLTVKVFSMLGTQSLCQAAASCTMFNKLALDPACYVEVDLTTRGGPSKVSNRTVNKVVQRAGSCLRSLKLGILPRPIRLAATPDKVLPLSCTGHERGPLTRNCLESLSADHGLAGASLTILHVFNLDQMDSKYLCRAIASCPSLTDLEVVGLSISVKMLMESLGSHCPKLKRLCCQPAKPITANGWSSSTVVSINTSACHQLVKGCPNLSSLALRNYAVADQRANILLKGLPQLTLVDFSGAVKLTGVFLRGVVGPGDQPSLLQTILLRDCMRLKEVEVERFMYMLITGECKNLCLLDISNKDGLAARDWFDRRLSPSTEQAIFRVRQERTELCLHAEFPDQKSSDSDSLISSFDDSDDSGPLRINSSDYTSTSSTTDSDDDDEDDNDDDSGFMSHDDSDMSLVHSEDLFPGDPELGEHIDICPLREHTSPP